MEAFDWSVRVYYEDTDAGGVVYYARYLAFYERARTEMLRQFGISQQSLLEKQNIAFVVKKMNINYISSARLDDLLIVRSRVESVRWASLIFKQQIMDHDNHIYNEAEVLIACVDLERKKACVFPESFISEFYKWKI